VFLEAIVVGQILFGMVFVREERGKIVWVTRVVDIAEVVQEVSKLSLDEFLLLISIQVDVPIQSDIRLEAIDCSLFWTFRSCLVDSLLKNCALKAVLV